MQISIFDLDHTLLRANSSYRFGNYLYRHQAMSFFTLLVCLANYACHKGLGLSVKRIHQNIFKVLFNGRALSEIQGYVADFLDKELDSLINPIVYERLTLAQKNGHHTIILSSSPDFLVSAIAERLSVLEWKGTEFSTNSHGYLSHIVQLMEGTDKALYIKNLVKKNPVSFLDITFYTDSSLDLPALKLAGKPIGVAPDKKLKKLCQKNGWEIL